MKTSDIAKIEESGTGKLVIKVFLHLILWVIFFTLPLLFRPQTDHSLSNHGLPVFMPTPMLINNIYLIIIFYINLYVLMPMLFNKKRWFLYVLFIVIFMLVSYMLHDLLRSFDKIPRDSFPADFPQNRPRRAFEYRQFSFVYTFLMVWAISMVYHLIVQLQKSKQHAERVLANALHSELSFLKAQINPHFLFNTLNNIYSLALKKSDDAPVAILKLSNLMRQMTNDTGVNFIPFEVEDQFIRDYIEIQQLRLTDKTKVNYQSKGSFDRMCIAPRLLIPFIDNAFKYGVSNRYPSSIDIYFNFADKWLTFTIKNKKHKKVAESIEESAGVGLENVKRRLDLLYDKKYKLEKIETDDTFSIHLEIKLEC